MRFLLVRRTTERLCAPLSAEDMQVQSMPEASPAKWHLGHTTWFFETFVLRGEPFRPGFRFIFNSYYDAVGARHPRPERGVLSRPSLEEVLAYRCHVDARVLALVAEGAAPEVADVIELGLQHEQQHQELLVTDVKHAFSRNPLQPVYGAEPELARARGLRWLGFGEELVHLGAPAAGFAYDNERPRHRVLVPRFEIASRLATVGEFRRFMEEGGYRRPELWLSDGWRLRAERGWDRPLYWAEDGRTHFTLAGPRPLADDEPVRHVSYFEADAFARWAGARLPREAEWELAATRAASDLEQAHRVAWQWTQSAYSPYPGFTRLSGGLGEYNAKFMSGQLVLRGSSSATPEGHARATYRNFWPPETRWQLSGVRLARDA